MKSFVISIILAACIIGGGIWYAAYLEDIKADKAKRYAAYSEIDFYSMNNARRERAKMVIKRKREGR